MHQSVVLYCTVLYCSSAWQFSPCFFQNRWHLLCLSQSFQENWPVHLSCLLSAFTQAPASSTCPHLRHKFAAARIGENHCANPHRTNRGGGRTHGRPLVRSVGVSAMISPAPCTGKLVLQAWARAGRRGQPERRRQAAQVHWPILLETWDKHRRFHLF